MDRRQGRDELDKAELADAEFERLFAALDGVTASSELKASTIDAIFARMDAEQDGPDETRLGEARSVEAHSGWERPALTLVGKEPDAARPASPQEFTASVPAVERGDVGGHSSQSEVEQDDPDEARLGEARSVEVRPGEERPALVLVGKEPDAAEPQDSEPSLSHDARQASDPALSRKPASHAGRRRSRSWMLRVAAAVVALTVAVGGGVAYALPASHVRVVQGDTTFDLAVNVFGLTVGVTADSAEGEAVLAEVDARNKGYEEALGLVLDAYGERLGTDAAGSVAVSVDGPLAGPAGEPPEGVTRALDDFEARRAQQQLGAAGAEGAAGTPGGATDATGQATPAPGTGMSGAEAVHGPSEMPSGQEQTPGQAQDQGQGQAQGQGQVQDQGQGSAPSEGQAQGQAQAQGPGQVQDQTQVSPIEPQAERSDASPEGGAAAAQDGQGDVRSEASGAAQTMGGQASQPGGAAPQGVA